MHKRIAYLRSYLFCSVRRVPIYSSTRGDVLPHFAAAVFTASHSPRLDCEDYSRTLPSKCPAFFLRKY